MANDKRKRIGVHLGTTGGAWTAVNRAVEAGANTFQIFSSSPRQWKAAPVKPEDAAKMKALRAQHDIGPVAIHASYLINLCSQTESVRVNATAAFRGEVERALALGAEYLVLHPGSWKGLTRDEGLRLAAESIERAIDGLPWQDHDFRILIENTAGAEFSLGGKLEQVAELVECLKACAPVAVCLDTCHVHVAGYDIVSADGYIETMKLVGDTVGFDAVKVWHCNDAKAPFGSKLDRHEHIGEGTIGAEAFRRLLHDKRFAGAAFIAETPVDAPGDEARNVGVLRTLAAG
ncbi:deoxyribonuclease IV [Granulicella sp. WH15]|uniref:deoxyribonuclease IV n=1 Tax=Granulicella sp. WH15 TaxID=2602070 RepID=UPI0013675BAE|nr:deoxyribonuclease IV [Granulicella sp. WH15]QHN03883.1 deoxyribonuclease IV [Granulicella sp. WH15]